MRTYVLLRFDTPGVWVGEAYQEAEHGDVTRYLAPDGTELFVIPPTGDGGVVVDPDPPRLDWML